MAEVAPVATDTLLDVGDDVGVLEGAPVIVSTARTQNDSEWSFNC